MCPICSGSPIWEKFLDYWNKCIAPNKEKTMKRLSEPAVKVLEGASADVEAWIEDAGEDWINAMVVHNAPNSTVHYKELNG